MAGLGQYGISRQSATMQQQNKSKKQGFFGAGEDDDSEPSIYFQTPFRPEKEMMTSASPSQLTGFGSNLYSQPPTGALNNMNLPQRGMSNAPPFQRNVTPTSIGPPNFPIGLPPQQASPNRGLFSMSQRGILNAVPQSSQAPISSQIKRPNPISAGLMSSNTSTSTSITSSAMAAFRSHGDTSQPSLDLSEFPTLGNRAGAPPNPTPAARNYVGMVSKQAQDPAPEFQIQQEDFPALPGAQNPPTSSASDNVRKTPTSSPGVSSYEQALSKDGAKFPGDKSVNNQPRRGIQTHPDGTVSNIPSGMVTDQFGMVGLLTFIRAADNDPNLVALAPGIDLTTLGLNLNSQENLYSTFQSPWADAPCRPQDIDFHVPSEYLTNIFIRDKLAPIKLNRYTEDLLFFLFYMNGGDVLQLAAAAELYNRDWRYHKEERVWITRVPGMEPMVKTTTYERGTYYFFDAQNWRKVAKEFRLEYDKLEDRPHLPPTLLHNPNQPPPIMPAVMSH